MPVIPAIASIGGAIGSGLGAVGGALGAGAGAIGSGMGSAVSGIGSMFGMGGGATGATGASTAASTAGATTGATTAAEQGLISKVGETLGFSGEGGGLMKGLGNLQKIQGMAGGGGGGEYVAPDAGSVNIDQAPISGFDVSNYEQQVPEQFFDGGFPNDGKPAGIYDLRTGNVTGTMNEKGAEAIVPAYAMGSPMGIAEMIQGGKAPTPAGQMGALAGNAGGIMGMLGTLTSLGQIRKGEDKVVPAFASGGQKQEFSIIDSAPPRATQNMTVDPRVNMAGFGSPTPSQGMAAEYFNRQGQEEEDAANTLNQYKAIMEGGVDPNRATKGKSDNPDVVRTERTGDGKGKGGGLSGLMEGAKGLAGDVDWGGLIKGLTRATGYYYDMRRNRYGLGTSALTQYLDWTERGEQAEKGAEDKTAQREHEKDRDKTKHDYTMKEIRERAKYDTGSGDDLDTYEAKLKLKREYADKDNKDKDLTKIREEASEDFDDLRKKNPKEYKRYYKMSGKDKEKAKKLFMEDRVQYASKGNVPEYKETKTKNLFGREKKKNERTGEYVPSSNSADVKQEDAGDKQVTAKGVNKKTGQVYLSDGNIVSIDEARKMGIKV